jgi:hypothetical protein
MATKAQIAANRRNAKKIYRSQNPGRKGEIIHERPASRPPLAKSVLPDENQEDLTKSTPDSRTYTSRKPSPSRTWSSRPSSPSGNWSAPKKFETDCYHEAKDADHRPSFKTG